MGDDSKELPQPVQPKGVSRRAFLGRAILGALAGQDVVRGLGEMWEEYTSQEGVKGVNKIVDFLETADFEVPQDKLYGFTYPSTKEMSQRWKEALHKTVGDPPMPYLLITQRNEPSTLTKRLISSLRLGEVEGNPFVTRPAPGKEDKEGIFLSLPASTKEDSLPKASIFLYHEGLHLFFQPSPIGFTPEEVFETENMPNVGEILFERTLFEKEFIEEPADYAEIISAYDKAVAEKKPEIWEKRFKELYKLPEDCCVAQR